MPVSAPVLSATDRPRPKKGTGNRSLVVAAVVVASTLLLVATLRPAEPAVERSSLVIDTVRRGSFVHEIAAAGSLLAEQPRVVAAPVSGRVDAIRVEPGDRVRKGDVIIELANRETLRQLLEAEQQLAAASADLADLEATLQVRSLEAEKSLRRTEFERQDAQRQAEATSELARQGLMSSLEAIRQREAAAELAERAMTESRRQAALMRSADAQMAAQRNRLERLRALEAFHRGIVESLTVRAPAEATVRDISVQQGQWVSEGQPLVRLVEPGRLKAVLLVPEAAAHELRAGQQVAMNARGAMLRGEISRIAAAVEQGTLAVDVKLEGELPASARPELSVDGRIEISRVADSLSIGRAARAMAGEKGVLYKLDPDGRTARRTTVRYGPAGVDRIVVVEGASAGDQLVVAGLEDRTDPVFRIE